MYRASLYFVLLPQTNAQIYIYIYIYIYLTIFSLYIIFTLTCFDTFVFLSEVQVLKLPGHDTEVSKYVGVKII